MPVEVNPVHANSSAVQLASGDSHSQIGSCGWEVRHPSDTLWYATDRLLRSWLEIWGFRLSGGWVRRGGRPAVGCQALPATGKAGQNHPSRRGLRVLRPRWRSLLLRRYLPLIAAGEAFKGKAAKRAAEPAPGRPPQAATRRFSPFSPSRIQPHKTRKSRKYQDRIARPRKRTSEPEKTVGSA